MLTPLAREKVNQTLNTILTVAFLGHRDGDDGTGRIQAPHVHWDECIIMPILYKAVVTDEQRDVSL